MISRKIGLHLFGNPAVPLGRPAVVKTVDPSLADYWNIRSEVGDECLIVVRFYYRDQNLDRPEERANSWFTDHKAFIANIPSTELVAYEGFNEIPESQSEEHCRYEVERMRLLHAINRRAAVGCWSVGVPNERSWYKYEGMLRAMYPSDFLALHEYWSDNADIDNRWHVGRWTLPEAVPYLAGIKIVLTEGGRDYTPDTKAGAPGWRKTTNEEGFLADLRKVGDFLDLHPNVVGITIFEDGSIDPDWIDFRCGSLWPRVTGEYPTESAPVTEPAPVEEPAPLTLTLLQPVEKYGRISWQWDPPHHFGIDYSCVEGTPVRAAVDGIAHRGNQYTLGFGIYIRIETGDGLFVYVAHLQAWAVPDGTLVQAGDIIGFSGNTGNSSGPHVHFEVRKGKRDPSAAIDPTPYMVASLPVPEPAPEPEPALYLPENDPLTLAAATLADRTTKLVWWLEEEARKREANDAGYADAIHMSLIATAIKWRDGR